MRNNKEACERKIAALKHTAVFFFFFFFFFFFCVFFFFFFFLLLLLLLLPLPLLLINLSPRQSSC
jgi:hypothetical protein